MFVYTKTFSSAQVGQIQKEVRCERCDCEYTYQMIRRGSGRSTSVYGLGEKTAKQQAQNVAGVKLAKLLQRQHDPVACPDCGWIQSYMVEDLRRRAHRWIMKLAWVLAAILVVCAILGYVGAATSWANHGVDKEAWLQIGGLGLLAIFVAVAGNVVRVVLSSFINPNRNYPHRPAPIPGAPIGIKQGGAAPPFASVMAPIHPASRHVGPPPLVSPSNALSHEQVNPLIESGGWVTVQLAKAQYPLHCCSCLTGTTTLKQFNCAQLSRIAIPMCKACDKQRIANQTFTIISGLVWGGCLPYLLCLFVQWMSNPVVWTPLGAGIGLVTALCMRGRANPVKFSCFNSDLNTIRLRFRNPAYLQMLIDHGKLV